jgi:hypothetical protein
MHSGVGTIHKSVKSIFGRQFLKFVLISWWLRALAMVRKCSAISLENYQCYLYFDVTLKVPAVPVALSGGLEKVSAVELFHLETYQRYLYFDVTLSK